MILIGLRYKVAHFLLRSKAAKVKRQKTLYDFASAKHIGLLCAPKNEADSVLLKDFLNRLSQKEIKYSVLGYIDKEEIPENLLYWKNIDFITQKDLNLFFIPDKNLVVKKFIDEPFDMVINCNLSNYFPLEYASQLSVAKCKVGIKRDGDSGYDLMIDISKERTVEYFLKNLEIYLSNLRNPK